MDRDSTGPSKNRTIPGAIKGLFKSAAQALLRSGDVPEPKPRRKSGETEKGFGLAAKVILRRAARIPPEAYAAASGTLFATLDWLNPWQSEADNFAEFDNELGNSDTHPPSLHL